MTPTQSVWIFEDEPAVGQLLVDLLSAEGFAARVCSTIDPPEPRAPALAVLDLRMATGRGMRLADALARVRSVPGGERVPALVMTGDLLMVRELGRELSELPNVAILPKPFQLDGMLDMTRAMVRLAAGGREQVLLADVAVLLADAAGRYIGANARALALLGYSIDELRSMSVADVMDLAPERTQHEWDRYRAERSWQGRATLRRADGGSVTALVTAAIVESGDETLHVAWLRPEG
ncbi:MAG TPA: PAS domain S-box protein [Candidatus Limnocylindria bacterium]|nr:PAS domain S-box protein [Candidatus Limnocylindria bacterium]